MIVDFALLSLQIKKLRKNVMLFVINIEHHPFYSVLRKSFLMTPILYHTFNHFLSIFLLCVPFSLKPYKSSSFNFVYNTTWFFWIIINNFVYDMLNSRFQKILKILKGFFNYTDNNKYNLLNNIYNKIQIGNHTQQI